MGVRQRKRCDLPCGQRKDGGMMGRESPPGCLMGVFRLLGIGDGGGRGGGERVVPLPYRRKEFLLSRTEASFFGVLNQVVGGEYFIFAKVRLLDLMDLPRGTESRQGAQNRIQSKHVDFVLCERNGIRPCLVIE